MSGAVRRLLGPALPATLLRLALAAALLLPLALYWGNALVEALLPALRAVFGGIADEFTLLSLVPDHEGADRVLRATVTWKRIIVLGGHVIYPDVRGTAQASTLIVQGLYGPLLALAGALVWPAQGAKEYGLRLLLLAPLLVALALVDLPCVLAGELWEIVRSLWMPDAFSPLAVWKGFLLGGGRYALGLVAAAVAVHGARRLLGAPAPQSSG